MLGDILWAAGKQSRREAVKDAEMPIICTYTDNEASAINFLTCYRELSDALIADRTFFLAMYLHDHMYLAYEMRQWQNSKIAGAALIVASRKLREPSPWTEQLAAKTGIRQEELEPVVAAIEHSMMTVSR